MAQILTPSTGEVREGGNLRLNFLRIKVGDRILFRSETVRFTAGGWMIAPVRFIGEFGVTTERVGRDWFNPTWKDIAGIVAEGADEEATIANLHALEKRGDEMIADARKAKWDAVRVVLELPEVLSRVAIFTPGE